MCRLLALLALVLLPALQPALLLLLLLLLLLAPPACQAACLTQASASPPLHSSMRVYWY